MSKRRSHSSIDKLPADLRDDLMRMIVDNEWPEDFPDAARPEGNPRYEDLARHCRNHDYPISESAVGRWAMQMRTLARMKHAGVITREVMADLGDGQVSQSQKAVAEMITAVAIEFISSQDTFDAKQIRDVANAMKDCTAVAINSDKYVREQVTKKAKAAAEKIDDIGGKKKIDPETLKLIREQVYGILS